MSTNVEQIKEKLDIVDVISSYIKVEKAGVNFKAKCPFHNEKTPSFLISPVRQTFYCFGCQEKGDIFSFVEKFEGLDFKGALETLANRAGIENLKGEAKEKPEVKDRLFEIMEEATKFFEKELLENKESLKYLEKRGLTKESIIKWRLGFAKDGWRNLHDYLTAQKFTKEEIVKALKKVQQERAKLEKKQRVLKARKQDIKKKEGLMRRDRNSFVSSDPDATVMMMKEGYIAPGYNVQLATEHQVILGYGVSSDRNDTKLLKPTVEEVKERTGRKPETISSDSGYGTKKNYRYLKKERIAPYIPYPSYEQERILKNKGLFTPPKQPDRELEKYKFRQRLRLQSEEGKLMMKRRREDVEPVIGNLKRNLGFRRFSLRGKRKCELELGLFSVAHNLIKIRNWVRKLAEWDDGRKKGIELGIVLGYRTA